MKILMAASEVVPFAKTGGLGDVAAALPRQLYRDGHDVRPFVPLYGTLDREAHEIVPVDGAQAIPLRIGWRIDVQLRREEQIVGECWAPRQKHQA